MLSNLIFLLISVWGSWGVLFTPPPPGAGVGVEWGTPLSPFTTSPPRGNEETIDWSPRPIDDISDVGQGENLRSESTSVSLSAFTCFGRGENRVPFVEVSSSPPPAMADLALFFPLEKFFRTFWNFAWSLPVPSLFSESPPPDCFPSLPPFLGNFFTAETQEAKRKETTCFQQISAMITHTHTVTC